jgi:hypothetical protein
MNSPTPQTRDERGFVLITALLIMLVLTILGIATTTNTSIELQIAGNDKVHKRSFYEAEGGAMLGSELLEQNFNCPVGFTSAAISATVNSRNTTFATNSPFADVKTERLDYPQFINNYDAAYTLTAAALPALPAQEVGYLHYGGNTAILPGGALQMAAGYEGKGKSAAQGGVAKMVDIYSQFKGMINSESIILFGWRHLVGTEGLSPYCP